MVAVRAVDALADHAHGRGGAGPEVRAHRRLVRRGRAARRVHARRSRSRSPHSASVPFGPSATTALALVALGAFAGATVDTKLLGFGPPFLCRQVNQDWLLNYRSWVYGGGFGWQIGAGVTTYVMTAAVPLMIVVGALGADARRRGRDRCGVRPRARPRGAPRRPLAHPGRAHRVPPPVRRARRTRSPVGHRRAARGRGGRHLDRRAAVGRDRRDARGDSRCSWPRVRADPAAPRQLAARRSAMFGFSGNSVSGVASSSTVGPYFAASGASTSRSKP